MRRRRNKHMKSSSRLLLGCILVMITVLGDSYARVLPGHQEVNKNRVEVTEIAAMHAQKESFERNEVAYVRKLTTHEETTASMDSKNRRRRSADNGEEGTSKNSGKEEYGLHKSSSLELEQKNYQINKQSNNVEAEASKFTNRGSSSLSNTNTKYCSQDCNDDVAAYNNTSTLQKDENENLVEAATKEIGNLMYMDYKGKPSHKPPINNHDPGN